MGRFLKPLFVFASGQILLLFAVIFFPAVGTAATNLQSSTAAWGAIGWGWTWVVSSAKWLVYIFMELLILYATAKAFLASNE